MCFIIDLSQTETNFEKKVLSKRSYTQKVAIHYSVISHKTYCAKKLLESFCRYQEALNDPNENSEGHWDLAIFMTGLDLWSKEGAFNTLGLAHTGGMCKPAYSCLVTEFGTRKNHVHQLNNDYSPPHNGSKLQKPSKNQI